jgi:hypothetical protein
MCVCTRVYPKVSGLAAWNENCKCYQLSATRCNCITILWSSLVSFAVITLCVASQQVFVVVVSLTQSGNFCIHRRICVTHTHEMLTWLTTRMWIETLLWLLLLLLSSSSSRIRPLNDLFRPRLYPSNSIETWYMTWIMCGIQIFRAHLI